MFRPEFMWAPRVFPSNPNTVLNLYPRQMIAGKRWDALSAAHDSDIVRGMTAKNPFPGMNPFIEQRWRDAHTMLIAYLRDALQERLPIDLVAGAEEEIVTIGASERSTTYRPDVQVREPLTLKEPLTVDVMTQSPSTVAAKPLRVFLDEQIERWLEVRDTTGRLITVLELLSPTNKLESDERDRYCRKRRALVGGGVNVVEIDLVRQGAPIFPNVIRSALREAGACYAVCVFRAVRPVEREVYPIRLNDRLPPISIPLRPNDADVTLDLQPLIDQCHERGRYHLLNYQLELDPPLPPDAAGWVDQILREHGLRSTVTHAAPP
jgi:hypothetical protein